MSDSATQRGGASRWLRRALWALFALCLAGVLALGATVMVLLPQLPDTSSLANYQPKQPLRVYTADGVEIGGFGQEKREYLRIEQFPKMMRDSLLAVGIRAFTSTLAST